MKRQSVDGGFGLEKSKIEIEQEFKFRLFFTALIFAILSFAVQHPVESERTGFLKITEILAWIILFLSGYFALAICSGVHLSFIKNMANKIKWSDEEAMWLLFYGSIFLLLIVKSFDRF